MLASRSPQVTLTSAAKRSAQTCTMPKKSKTAKHKSHVSNAQSTDGDPAINTTSGKSSGGDASGLSERNDGSMRVEVLDNEESFFKIKLEDEILVDSRVVGEAMELGMSPHVADMTWVTFNADTKEVNRIYT